MFDLLEKLKSFSEIVECIIAYSYIEYQLSLRPLHDAKHQNLLESYKQKYCESEPPDEVDRCILNTYRCIELASLRNNQVFTLDEVNHRMRHISIRDTEKKIRSNQGLSKHKHFPPIMVLYPCAECGNYKTVYQVYRELLKKSYTNLSCICA